MTERISTQRTPRARRVRRVAAVLASAGALAVGLTACNVQPGAAGFVASDRITQDQVNTITTGVSDELHGTLSAANYTRVRQTSAMNLVMRELCRRVTAAQGFPAAKPDYPQTATNIGLKQNNRYVRLVAETSACVDGLVAHSSPATVTEADYKLIYGQLVASGLDPKQLPYGAAKAQIAKLDGIGQKVATRNLLQAGVRKYHVDLNPMYGPAEFPLTVLSSNGLTASLPVVLGKGSPKVVVTRSAEATNLTQG